MELPREDELIQLIRDNELVPEKIRSIQFRNTIVLDCNIGHFLDKASTTIEGKDLNWNREVYYIYGYYNVSKIIIDPYLAIDENEESARQRELYNNTVDSLDLTRPRSLMLAFDSDDILYVCNEVDNWIEEEALTNPDYARVLDVISASN